MICKEGSRNRHHIATWKLHGASYTMHFERQFKDGYGNEASLSLSLSLSLSEGTLRAKPGRRAPLLGTLKDT